MKKISNNKIPFGLKNGILIEVSDVVSGLACGCVCPACHRALQANKGKKVSHYFSHDPSHDTKICESAFETAIHLMAKQILSEECRAIFPPLTIKVSQADVNGNVHEEVGSVVESIEKQFENVVLEQRLDDIRPDIIAYQGETPYLIEVAVTHFSDNEKKALIRTKGLYAIEIDLSHVSYETTKKELRLLIIDKEDNKKWLSNPSAIQVKRMLAASLDEKVRKINEGIYKNQKQRIETSKKTPIAKSKSTVVGYSTKPVLQKQYNPRWFVCEACRHLFKVPLREAPYSIETLPCPECEHQVSART